MRTKKISLYYQVSSSEIFPPPGPALSRKESWIKEVQRTISKEAELRMIKVTYEVFNPDVERQRKFFNGPVVDYYAIQNEHITSGEVPRGMHDRYRETILAEALGYEVELVGRKERRRKSSADFNSTQQWNDFLEGLRETIFEPNGYEMPESEVFWEMSKKYGEEQAQKIALEELQRKIIAKMGVKEA